VVRKLAAIYRELKPVVVHHFTANPVICGTLAARLTGVGAIANALPGLGTVFESKRWDAPMLRAWLRAAYRLASRVPNSRMIFQNPDDVAAFVSSGVVPESAAILIPSSGVDTQAFYPQPEPAGVPTILFCGRILRAKGIADLAAAARLLRQWQVDFRIRLVGLMDSEHQDALPISELDKWQREGLLDWEGVRHDIPATIAAAHLVVLPARQREGTPRLLLEGAASGRALVATDVAGSRAVVRHEHNGLLVAPRDPHALAQALARLIGDPQARQRFGQAGRELVLRDFDQTKVNAATADVYRTLLAGGS
jgi:glycosyltransferase involved in cell wall biosynthesis